MPSFNYIQPVSQAQAVPTLPSLDMIRYAKTTYITIRTHIAWLAELECPIAVLAKQVLIELAKPTSGIHFDRFCRVWERRFGTEEFDGIFSFEKKLDMIEACEIWGDRSLVMREFAFLNADTPDVWKGMRAWLDAPEKLAQHARDPDRH